MTIRYLYRIKEVKESLSSQNLLSSPAITLTYWLPKPSQIFYWHLYIPESQNDTFPAFLAIFIYAIW